jgi:hypothetical protein
LVAALLVAATFRLTVAFETAFFAAVCFFATAFGLLAAPESAATS